MAHSQSTQTELERKSDKNYSHIFSDWYDNGKISHRFRSFLERLDSFTRDENALNDSIKERNLCSMSMAASSLYLTYIGLVNSYHKEEQYTEIMELLKERTKDSMRKAINAYPGSEDGRIKGELGQRLKELEAQR